MRCSRCHAENRDNSKFCGNCASPLRSLGPEAPTVTKTLDMPVQDLTFGSLITGKYRVIEELGHGGMGIVYKAEDIKLKRFVALKFLAPHLMDSPDLKERFLVEAKAATALNLLSRHGRSGKLRSATSRQTCRGLRISANATS